MTMRSAFSNDDAVSLLGNATNNLRNTLSTLVFSKQRVLCILVYLNNEVYYNIGQWKHHQVPNKGTNSGPDEYAAAFTGIYTLLIPSLLWRIHTKGVSRSSS